MAASPVFLTAVGVHLSCLVLLLHHYFTCFSSAMFLKLVSSYRFHLITILCNYLKILKFGNKKPDTIVHSSV